MLGRWVTLASSIIHPSMEDPERSRGWLVTTRGLIDRPGDRKRSKVDEMRALDKCCKTQPAVLISHGSPPFCNTVLLELHFYNS